MSILNGQYFNTVIDCYYDNVISTDMRSENYSIYKNLALLALDWEACFDTPNIHCLRVKTNISLNTPSFLNYETLFKNNTVTELQVLKRKILCRIKNIKRKL